MFLNSPTVQRPQVVARHEVGHASDQIIFGSGDHATDGLMNYTGDIKLGQPDGDPNFSDDSLNKLRGKIR